mmetsp:Transcript_113063/g.252257  ORF Transcript_113063/g.252257 Transcript_113063/m.252257 type:complete len:195 (+) Transcript_113063:1-585(+)
MAHAIKVLALVVLSCSFSSLAVRIHVTDSSSTVTANTMLLPDGDVRDLPRPDVGDVHPCYAFLLDEDLLDGRESLRASTFCPMMDEVNNNFFRVTSKRTMPDELKALDLDKTDPASHTILMKAADEWWDKQPATIEARDFFNQTLSKLSTFLDKDQMAQVEHDFFPFNLFDYFKCREGSGDDDFVYSFCDSYYD